MAQDGWVDALGCPPISDASCRPTLTGTRSPGGPWQLMALPAPRSLLPPVLAGAGGSTLLFAAFDVHTAAIRLWVSDDGGRRWSARRAPTWDGHRCTGPATMMAAAGRRAWWLLCLGNAGAGTSTKALERSADGGKRWQIVSAAPAPGTISSGEPTALAAGDSQHLWLALANGVLESRDGGVRWSGVPGITPQDRPTELDVLSGRRAWLLVSGAGLWRTRDGWHWRRLGPQRG